MAPTEIDMSEWMFILINVPLVFLCLMVKIFFACSLIFPPRDRQKLKQPLKTLLGFLVWCTIIYLISLTIMYCVLQMTGNLVLFFLLFVMVQYTMYLSMTSYVWLTFYYYTQIVPARQALSIWVKRNIKSIIYVILFLDRSIFIFSSIVSVSDIAIKYTDSNASYINSTKTGQEGDKYVDDICFVLMGVYIKLCLCVMMVSSFSTVRYLYRHMRSMAMSSSPFSSQRFRSQMRVTVTGILQGLLYLLYNICNDLILYSSNFSPNFYIGPKFTYTVSTLYMCGTTVNMAVGQAVFRQKAVDVWMALKAFCVDGTAGNDVKLQSNQPTSRPAVETS